MEQVNFWDHTAFDNAGCLLWSGSTTTGGYGQYRYRGRLWLAHRLAWTLCRTAIPAGMIVRHLCNRPACVLPAHLALGTQVENAAGHDVREVQS
jgi:hypothetical protein